MMQRPIVGTTPLEELRDSGKEFFTPGDVSRVLGCDPQSIRLQARQCPERLGFPVSHRKPRQNPGKALPGLHGRIGELQQSFVSNT